MSDHQDPETLRRLHHDEQLSLREIADQFGVNHNTIWYHMKKHGIERLERTRPKLSTPVPFHTTPRGYEKWRANDRHEKTIHTVYVHRLLAVAEYGFEAVDSDTDVHHKNGCAFDNRPGNIELMGHREHRLHHAGIERGEADV